MSIVQNLKLHRLIALALLWPLSHLTFSQSHDSSAELKSRLLSQWQQLRGVDTDASIELVGRVLQPCQQTLDYRLSGPLLPGRNQIELQCQQPFWQQNLALVLHSWESVLVLTEPVRNDEALTPDQVRRLRRDVSELTQGYFSDLDDIRGMSPKRHLRAGTVLAPDMLQGAQVIERGDPVEIRLQRGAIQLSVAGVAMNDGRIGERIRVRNQQSGQIIRAVTRAAGVVELR